MLSTGMANMNELKHVVDTIRAAGCNDLIVLNCVSNYPVAHKECNLAAIRTIRDTLNCRTGWSDHSHSADVLVRAAHR